MDLDVAALAVACIALLVSGASVIYTAKQARSAEASEVRALTPRISAQIETVPGLGPVIRVLNQGPVDLDIAELEVVQADQNDPASIVIGMSSQRDLRLDERVTVISPFRMGASELLVPVRGGGPWMGGTLRIRTTCRKAKRSWVVVVDTPLPSA